MWVYILVWIVFMTVWSNEKQFIALLERKQNSLNKNIIYTERKIKTITEEIEKNQQEQQYLNQQINLLTPSGVLERADIYKGIRHQGSLLIHVQMIIHKITQLEDEKYKHQHLLSQYRADKQLLDKRLYKLMLYLKKQQRDLYRRHDNNAENEMQENAIYDRNKI